MGYFQLIFFPSEDFFLLKTHKTGILLSIIYYRLGDLGAQQIGTFRKVLWEIYFIFWICENVLQKQRIWKNEIYEGK